MPERAGHRSAAGQEIQSVGAAWFLITGQPGTAGEAVRFSPVMDGLRDEPAEHHAASAPAQRNAATMATSSAATKVDNMMRLSLIR